MKTFERIFYSKLFPMIAGMLLMAILSTLAGGAFAAPNDLPVVTVDSTYVNARYNEMSPNIDVKFMAVPEITLTLPVVNLKDLVIEVKTYASTGKSVYYRYPAKSGFQTLSLTGTFTPGTDGVVSFVVPASKNTTTVHIVGTPKAGMGQGAKYGFFTKPPQNIVFLEGYERTTENEAEIQHDSIEQRLWGPTATAAKFNTSAGTTFDYAEVHWVHAGVEYRITLECTGTAPVICNLPDGTSVSDFGGRAAMLTIHVIHGKGNWGIPYTVVEHE